MAPTASRPVSFPLSTCLPLNDVRWMRRYPDRWPTDLTFQKHAANEKMSPIAHLDFIWFI